MTEIRYSQSPRPNRVAATVDHDGARLGHVTCKGRTFEAVRKNGTDADMRRVARGFRSADAAATWIAQAAA